MCNFRQYTGSFTGKKYKPGLVFDYTVSIPKQKVEAYGLVVEHDGPNKANEQALYLLAKEGKAPFCVYVGVYAGKLVFDNKSKRDMRMNCYDQFNREYADFLVYELIPYLTEKYQLKLYPSADMRMISGGSSGGLSAFCIGWFHPEYFHRVYMSSPSFLAMGRGNELPYLVRKCETKPLRIYEEYSENEPDEYFGSSYPVDIEIKNGLTFSKYDFTCKFFKGENHCSRYLNKEEALVRNEWLWKDWKTTPIAAPANSSRVDMVVPFSEKWEKCDPSPQIGTEKVAPQLQGYDHAVYSSDKKLIYCAAKSEPVVYAKTDVNAEGRLVHAYLHTLPDVSETGVIDMCVDMYDRLYVLTKIGIQCVRSFGLIDVILDLPDNKKPKKISVSDSTLYVETEDGVYRRKLRNDPVKKKVVRKCTFYYD